jgi:hypothetical protein
VYINVNNGRRLVASSTARLWQEVDRVYPSWYLISVFVCLLAVPLWAHGLHHQLEGGAGVSCDAAADSGYRHLIRVMTMIIMMVII